MPAKVLKVTKDNFSEITEEAASSVRKGGIVALPTETVYGLAVDFDNPNALKRLYEVKKRPQSKPFSIHIAESKSFSFIASSQPPFVYRLIERFWPGPLTLVVYDKRGNKIGIRNPDSYITQQIIRKSGCLVVMPSANISGQEPSVNWSQVWENFRDSIDLIVAFPQRLSGVSSTVLDVAGNTKLLRRGELADEVIQEVEKRRLLFVCSGNTCRSVMAEYLMRNYLQLRRPRLFKEIEISSCGVFALDGARASVAVVQLLKGMGVDASGHRSRKMKPFLIKGSDMVVVMEEYHKKIMFSLGEEVERRVFHINEFIPGFFSDLPDPIGKGMDGYIEVFDFVKKAVENIGKKL